LTVNLVVVSFTSFTVADPRATAYAPVPPITVNGALLFTRWAIP